MDELEHLIEVYKSENIAENLLRCSNPSEYKGLVLLEEKSFEGPTSIKYWM